MPIQTNSLLPFPERMHKVQLGLWKKEWKERLSDTYPIQSEISRRVVEYRKACKKRSQQMNFKKEDWYLELKAKEALLHARCVEAAEQIKLIGKKIDSLHRQKGTPYKTARGPKRRGRGWASPGSGTCPTRY